MITSLLPQARAVGHSQPIECDQGENSSRNGGWVVSGLEYPTRQDFLQESLILRSWGWSVFPLSQDKTPACGWKRFQDRKPTDWDLSRLFDRPSWVGGLAVVTGGVSGGRDWVLCCRDFDTRAGYKTWAGAHRTLADDCPSVLTARGVHVYCRLRGPDVFVNLSDGELRASRKHYCALPPSRHPSGCLYQWFAGWPSSLRDFPMLDMREAGFLDGMGPLHEPSQREHSRSTFSTPKKPNNPSYDLCQLPISADEATLQKTVREAVYRSLPERPGQRNEKLFYLARSLADLVPGVAATEWASAVMCWWHLALSVIRTKGWAETWNDFRRAWDTGRVPMSESRPQLAMRKATQATAVADLMTRLRNVCSALAAENGGTFHLSCRTAGKHLGVSHTWASRLLAQAVTLGLLIVVEKGRPSARTRRATYFRLGGPLVDMTLPEVSRLGSNGQ